ncbi:MAG: hypothetical protein K6C94_09615 [Candidatus Gastranaerophilales bacterium]|nr:hypothetical protein [Candidatus Gastranaerophilales bacterium]
MNKEFWTEIFVLLLLVMLVFAIIVKQDKNYQGDTSARQEKPLPKYEDYDYPAYEDDEEEQDEEDENSYDESDEEQEENEDDDEYNDENNDDDSDEYNDDDSDEYSDDDDEKYTRKTYYNYDGQNGINMTLRCYDNYIYIKYSSNNYDTDLPLTDDIIISLNNRNLKGLKQAEIDKLWKSIRKNDAYTIDVKRGNETKRLYLLCL